MSHILTVLSKLAEASRVRSRLEATPLTVCVWPGKVLISWRVAASNTLTALSARDDGSQGLSDPTEASRVPSGLKATPQSALTSVSALTGKTPWRGVGSQIFTV